MICICPVLIGSANITTCAFVGQNVTFSCNATINDSNWAFGENDIANSLRIHSTYSHKYVVTQAEGLYNLTIIHITINDTGTYFCHVVQNPTASKDEFELVVGKVS